MTAATAGESSFDTTALIEREERLRAILNSAFDAIITINERGTIDAVNPAAEKLFGYSAAEMVGQNVSMLMPSPHRERHNDYLKHYLETGVAKIIGIGREITAVRKDGTHFPAHLAVSVVNLPRLKLFTANLHDLSNRRRLEELVLAAAGREQKRIGQDLHDGVAQQLAGISFLCRSLESRLAKLNIPEAADARQIGQLINEVHGQVRTISHGLNPIVDKPEGLMLALAEFAAYISSTFAMPCRFECKSDVLIQRGTIATHVYRIAQEAVGNALKHGHAWNIRIELTHHADHNVLIIEDDGDGLPECPAASTGIGLQIMKSRAAMIGGTLEFGRPDGGGTLVRCVFPADSNAQIREEVESK